MYKIVHEPAACEAIKDSCRTRHRRKAFSFCYGLLYSRTCLNQIELKLRRDLLCRCLCRLLRRLFGRFLCGLFSRLLGGLLCRNRSGSRLGRCLRCFGFSSRFRSGCSCRFGCCFSRCRGSFRCGRCGRIDRLCTSAGMLS